MSHSIDETYDAYRETRRRARKEHTCDACKESIRAGDEYMVVGIVFQDDARTVKRCLRCQKIHEHLREKGGGDTWPAEKLNCGESYEDHWGECPPDIAALAFATREEMQRRGAKP